MLIDGLHMPHWLQPNSALTWEATHTRAIVSELKFKTRGWPGHFFSFTWWKTRHALHSYWIPEVNPLRYSVAENFRVEYTLANYIHTLYVLYELSPAEQNHAFQLFQKWKYPMKVILKYVKAYKMYTRSNANSSVKCSIEVAQSTTQIRKFQKLMVHGLLFYNSIEAILHSQNSLT